MLSYIISSLPLGLADVLAASWPLEAPAVAERDSFKQRKQTNINRARTKVVLVKVIIHIPLCVILYTHTINSIAQI